LWHDLGSVFALKGEHDSALGAFERMLRLAWVVASRTKAAVAFNKMGRIYRQKGDLPIALEYLERGHELFLGGRTWSKVVADNAAGNPAAVLTAADGPGRLTIAAWCLDDECTDAKRDALAESVAAQVRPAR